MVADEQLVAGFCLPDNYYAVYVYDGGIFCCYHYIDNDKLSLNKSSNSKPC